MVRALLSTEIVLVIKPVRPGCGSERRGGLPGSPSGEVCPFSSALHKSIVQYTIPTILCILSIYNIYTSQALPRQGVLCVHLGFVQLCVTVVLLVAVPAEPRRAFSLGFIRRCNQRLITHMVSEWKVT